MKEKRKRLLRPTKARAKQIALRCVELLSKHSMKKIELYQFTEIK